MREVGEKARAWKGERAGYVAIHAWLSKHHKKESCQHCGKSESDVSRLEWANISGKYLRDISDYLVLCPSCHRKMDLFSTHCKNGHPREGNTRIDSRGAQVCKICSKDAQKRWKEKQIAKD